MLFIQKSFYKICASGLFLTLGACSPQGYLLNPLSLQNATPSAQLDTKQSLESSSALLNETRAAETSKYYVPSITAIGFSSITNILFSVVFVIYYNLDVQGVALGTVISSTLTAIIFLTYTFYEFQKFTSIKINVAKILNVKEIQKLFSINIDIFIRSAILTFSFIFFTYLGNTISEDVVAANTILLNLIMLSAFILDAYAFSTEGIVGYSIGSKNKTLLTNVIKNSFILSSELQGKSSSFN